MTSPASKKHQLLVGFLEKALGTFVEQRDLGIVLSAPFQMKVEQGREPDLLFVGSEHLDRLKETHLQGPADLVVEIVSAESVGRDRGEKFYEYEQAGIPECWLIDPRTERAEFYQLTPRGRYELGRVDEEGIYRSRELPGFWLRVGWLWQTPLPRMIDVLCELELV